MNAEIRQPTERRLQHLYSIIATYGNRLTISPLDGHLEYQLLHFYGILAMYIKCGNEKKVSDMSLILRGCIILLGNKPQVYIKQIANK